MLLLLFKLQAMQLFLAGSNKIALKYKQTQIEDSFSNIFFP